MNKCCMDFTDLNYLPFPCYLVSPRDFWSRRWNLIVRNLLHSQVFENYSRRRGTDKDGQTSKPSQQKPQKVGFLSTRQGRGLLSFFVSGVFHELIICSVCRKLTLENLCFFCIHGIACMLEVKYYEPRRAQSQWRRVRNIALNIAFMTLTGRLFLAPFLRTRFTEVLPLTYAA
ncbi:hypothetical protein BDF20DRAFT_186961 [Mycotypha africana]|uniref:uncharacterized protein n=1 Tax=Mycotypha africana TaxID=64632 RepID=UPI0023002B0B|nr:uncharacterized protein BDF20DRAFT_186961 [Mycotypha africana]KAI8968537.1 hypothetical protein BDF20DRAFT_186961 [Mycotypha africana]